ncbi:RNA polymerase sigma-70 factor [Sphingobacterium sp. SGG-5]|uniref:RNA polymerase sigma factor n=1 Tax=Sphingobacterium sp. SGG-5 TaxID=2710881 RepID=UPI0013ECDCB7|nr:RNA polymerase sigma-70 factor [Sphingobacterium sp. SGG-5]NGM62146.1 RNA polymerase sigma-70 factor [Sphingobacterium sp. SGG-5]
MAVYETMSDQQLMDLFCSKDEVAFKELYNRYWETLLDSAFRRLGSIEQAEEIVQDIFVSLYLKQETLQIRTSVIGYLKNALKFKVLDVLRHQITHEKFVTHTLRAPGEYALTPDEILQIKELKEKIDRITQQMPEKCREVFLLSRAENLSNKKIATLLGISVSTVEKHIRKAMHILKDNFKGYNMELILLAVFLYKF